MLTAQEARKISKEVEGKRKQATIEAANKFCEQVAEPKIVRAANIGYNNVVITYGSEISSIHTKAYLEKHGFTVNDGANGSYSFVVSW